jgi:sucrose-6-phosphate hydrolase SacC (GH32 family)
MTDTHARPTDPPTERLTYHITHQPQDGMIPALPVAGDPTRTITVAADPNAIFFWAGRYHFHYFGFGDFGSAYAHASSPDLVHWTWHPTVLTEAALGHGMLSGSGFTTKEGRPAIIYASVPGGDLGTAQVSQLGPVQIAHALDDQLDSWSAPSGIELQGIPESDVDTISPWDPHGWLEGDTYYAIFGDPQPLPWLTGGKSKTTTVHKSADLQSWEYIGPLLSTDLPDAEEDSDVSCPDFFPIGREHMLLCISHNLGCRYYLGEWKDEQFTPTRHGRMNWQLAPHAVEFAGIDPGPRVGGRAVFFAPESLLTPDGRRVMWAWCWIDGLQDGIQSLPRELSLPDDGILRIAPLRELETLRSDEVAVSGIEVSSTGIRVVEEISGDTIEVSVTFQLGSAERFGVVVLCDADGHGGLPITVDTLAETVAVGDTAAPFVPESESVTLRVFIDKGMVEIFADDRQAVIGAHPYSPGNTHIGLFTDDRQTVDLIAWRLNSIYTDEHTVAGLPAQEALR